MDIHKILENIIDFIENLLGPNFWLEIWLILPIGIVLLFIFLLKKFGEWFEKKFG